MHVGQLRGSHSRSGWIGRLGRSCLYVLLGSGLEVGCRSSVEGLGTLCILLIIYIYQLFYILFISFNIYILLILYIYYYIFFIFK